MIVTARQLEDLHRRSGANGQLTLPYRARLTPLAADWVRARKILLGYANVEGPSSDVAKSDSATGSKKDPAAPAPGAFLWWCDGLCGPAKAAVVSFEKEFNFRPLDNANLVGAVRQIAVQAKAGEIAGAVLLVQHEAMASVLANRCPSLRAIVGTSLENVERGVRQVAANVLIIEHPQKTLQEVRNLLSRFLRAKRALPEEVGRQLQELASCG